MHYVAWPHSLDQLQRIKAVCLQDGNDTHNNKNQTSTNCNLVPFNWSFSKNALLTYKQAVVGRC